MSQVTNCVTAYSFFNITGCTLASAVLMATGSVSGKGQFLTPPQNSYPLTDHPLATLQLFDVVFTSK